MGQGQGRSDENMWRRCRRDPAAQQGETWEPHLEGQEGQHTDKERVCEWEVATAQGAAWPPSPVATGCQGNPCSTGIGWGVSLAAQTGCLHDTGWSPPGADRREGEGDDKGSPHQH